MYGTKDYTAMARTRLRAFEKIATALGKDHPITKMMGSRAWGRHDKEQGPESTLRKAIAEYASLDGAFSVLNTWARDNDRAAQRVMLDLYPSAMSTATSQHGKLTMCDEEDDEHEMDEGGYCNCDVNLSEEEISEEEISGNICKSCGRRIN